MKRPRYFQWIDGDNIGEIEKLTSITEMDGEYFYNFDSGESCNMRFISAATSDTHSLKGKVMVEIAGRAYAWKVEEITIQQKTDFETREIVDVPTLEDILQAKGQETTIDESSAGKMRLIPPVTNPILGTPLPLIDDYMESGETRTEIEKTDFKTVSENNNENVHPVNETVLNEPKTSPNKIYSDETDPVYILINKCKKHPTEISMSLNIDLPYKKIYDLANEEFDDGGDKFIGYIVKNIDVEIIKESLRTALKESYESQEE